MHKQEHVLDVSRDTIIADHLFMTEFWLAWWFIQADDDEILWDNYQIYAEFYVCTVLL